jgi:4-amino-4-deoxychorismate lyase
VVAAPAATRWGRRAGAGPPPRGARGGLAGTCRAALLAPLRANVAPILPREVESADAIFLCNAVRGILPVARLGARSWPPHPSVAAARQVLAGLHPGFSLDEPALDGPST